MSIKEDVITALQGGFDDSDSLLSAADLQCLEKDLLRLDPKAGEKRGFTLPLIDTIGLNTISNFVLRQAEDLQD